MWFLMEQSYEPSLAWTLDRAQRPGCRNKIETDNDRTVAGRVICFSIVTLMVYRYRNRAAGWQVHLTFRGLRYDFSWEW